MERPKKASGTKVKRITPKNPRKLTPEELTEFLAWSDEDEDVDISGESDTSYSYKEITSDEEESSDAGDDDGSLLTSPQPSPIPSTSPIPGPSTSSIQGTSTAHSIPVISFSHGTPTPGTRADLHTTPPFQDDSDEEPLAKRRHRTQMIIDSDSDSSTTTHQPIQDPASARLTTSHRRGRPRSVRRGRSVRTRGRSHASSEQRDRPRISTDVPRFVWSDGENFSPDPHIFDSNSSGLRRDCIDNENSKEIDYFLLYFDEKIMDIIVNETNNYFQFIHGEDSEEEVSQYSHMKRWYDTDKREMYTFLALIILMSHAPKLNVRDYWKNSSKM